MKFNILGQIIGILAILLLSIGCGVEKPAEIVLAESRLPSIIDFNYHIKPILSDKCYACHGPDKNSQKADLRLDNEEGAYKALSSGNGFAIKPGNISKSEVYHRIVSKNIEEVMPPPESNLELSSEEIAYIVKWIEQGAEYKQHWAFTKPEKSEVPNAGRGWAENEIDKFISRKLEEKNIVPSPLSQREVLVRRLYFDLIGLPPSVKDMERILNDTSPEYYERLVDTLLSSSAYGERMAAHWLDVARFADSEGYLDDFHHEMWPYRDWVIKAYNDNLPYNDFILWQVGGDQIPNATAEQRLATAFNRLHKQNSEGGAIVEEFRIDYVADRANTVGTAFMGMTVACARCHDHKYDPISQKNYFELFSFFNSTIEMGNAIFANNAIENGNGISPERSMNAGPVMPIPNKDIDHIREFIKREINDKTSELVKKVDKVQEPLKAWISADPSSRILEKVISNETVVHLNFDEFSNGKTKDKALGSKDAIYEGQEFIAGKNGLALKYNGGQLVADGSRVSFERVDPFAISFWIKMPDKINDARVIYNGHGRNQGYRGWEVVLDSARLSFRLNHAYPFQSLNLRMKQELALNEWHHFVWTYDGSSNANKMRIYQNGELKNPEIVRNYVYRSTRPYTDPEATLYEGYKGLILGSSLFDNGFDNGLIDDLRILDREAGEVVARYLYDEKSGEDLLRSVMDENSPVLKQFYALHIDDAIQSKREELRDIRLRDVKTIDTVQEIMVMGDSEKERPTFVLDRGVYDSPTEKVERDVPKSILPWPDDLPRNRYGLGKWLIHEDNPLTARVAVNQFWYLIFGRGLVETNEDFGNQGALPTHPELLDWLAVDFMKNGWDVKRLLRQMVTSSTYKQSSVIRADLLELDPDNKLLARSPRYRRSAEMVRDNLLDASGLLEKKIGGRSVFPYQPDGLWRETISHAFIPDYKVDYEKGLYRRSIYTFWKRNVPAPSMLVFDASNRSECQVERNRSNTPLQALVLLNSTQVIEACRVLSEEVLVKSSFEIPKAIDNVFIALISRSPTSKEKEILMKQFEEESVYFKNQPKELKEFLNIGAKKINRDFPLEQTAALARVANTIVNSTEAYYKN